MLHPIAPTSTESPTVLAEEKTSNSRKRRATQSGDRDLMVVVRGKHHRIKADRSEIFALLIASCERGVALERRTRELQAEVAKLKADALAKDEFLAKVSHELRTPITPIQGALAIMKSGKVAQLPERLEGMVDLANRNCTRLTSLVNDLLDFTRIGAGRFSIRR